MDPHADELHDQVDDHDRGLAFDLTTLVERRRMLKLLAGAGATLLVAACGGSGSSGSSGATTSAGATTSGGATTIGAAAATTAGATTTAASAGTVPDVIPEETGGPYPGDGSNGPNVLQESGVVRRDIRSSFGSSSTVAEGVPTTVQFTLVDPSGAPLSGAAVYLWHCDREGRYSMYSSGVTDENYLRGVQAADANGVLSFDTIYPGCYAGRWPHMHFEVYPSLDAATSASSKVTTSQLALTEAASAEVYATEGYEQSVQNLSRVSLATDNVFSDGAELETPEVTGSAADGFTLTITVTVDG